MAGALAVAAAAAVGDSEARLVDSTRNPMSGTATLVMNADGGVTSIGGAREPIVWNPR